MYANKANHVFNLKKAVWSDFASYITIITLLVLLKVLKPVVANVPVVSKVQSSWSDRPVRVQSLRMHFPCSLEIYVIVASNPRVDSILRD